MKRRLSTKLLPAFFATLCVLLNSGNVLAEGTGDEKLHLAEGSEDEKPYELAAQIDFNSAYMSRGQSNFDGMVVQPSLAAEYSLGEFGTLGASVWASFTADDSYSSEERFAEYDYTISHEVTISSLTLGVGHTWITYPYDADYSEATQEVSVSASLDVLLNPSLTYARDYSKASANYFSAGISQEIEDECLGDGVSVTPFAEAIFTNGSDGDYGYFANNGLASVVVGTSASFNVGSVGVSPAISYNFKVDDTTANKLWLTLTLTHDLI